MPPATEGGPLAGVKVLVTRPGHQASQLKDLLVKEGAQVLAIPAIKIEPIADTAPLDRALDEIAEYRWLVLTSVNSVEIFFDRLKARGIAPSALAHLSVAAIGPSTARGIEERGLKVSFVPDEYRAEGLTDGLIARGVAGTRVLLPRAKIARDVLPEGLKAAGARVDLIPIYETKVPADGRSDLVKVFGCPGIDVVTFTSSSTVEAFHQLAPERLPEGVVFAAIGPITAATAREHGFSPAVVAESYTVAGLVQALSAYFSSKTARASA